MEKPKNLTIIAIEGPDKVGKQTQSQLLEKRLRSLQITTPDLPLVTMLYEIPSSSGICHKEIYEALDGGADAPAKRWPEVFQALQVANRIDVQKRLLSKVELSPARNFVAVFDRWHVSSFAYGWPLGLSDDMLAYFRSMVWTPDMTFLLEGNGFDRDGPRDAYEDDGSFQSEVRKGYKRWYDENRSRENIVIVDADRDIDDVHGAITASCAAMLNSTKSGWRSNE